MNKKDLASLRRRFAPEKNDISIIRGCFVNEKRGIVSTFSKSPLSLPEREAEHYLASFKKTLGGALREEINSRFRSTPMIRLGSSSGSYSYLP